MDGAADEQLRQSRTFLIVAAAASLPAWEIGFELGAFETFSYRRIFAVFVLAAVVLIATFVVETEGLPRSWWSRAVLAVPVLYLVADLVVLTRYDTVVDVLGVATIVAFPYTVYVLGRVLGGDYFAMSRKLQVVAAATALAIALAGWHVGDANDRFLYCSEFERIGDYQPDNCARG